MKRLLLIGGGHAHLFVLQYLAEQAVADVQVTLVSPSRWVDYSGMLPGWMAGTYCDRACQIDLLPLTRNAQVTFIEASVVALNTFGRVVQLDKAGELHYDLLSLDTGSETNLHGLHVLGEKVIPVRPFADFRNSWRTVLQQCEQRTEFTLAIVGGGAAGVELALAARTALAKRVPVLKIVLIVGERGILVGHNSGVKTCAAQQLQNAGVEVINQRAQAGSAGLLLSDGSILSVDKVIAATGATPAAWLQGSGLALDGDGFVQVDATHRSVSEGRVFAAGNVCARVDRLLEKSGVHAVHAGPILARNLIAALQHRTLSAYQPRRFSLYLLSCANGQAIASWGPLYAQGRWLWWLKDYIDRRFIQRFTRL